MESSDYTSLLIKETSTRRLTAEEIDNSGNTSTSSEIAKNTTRSEKLNVSISKQVSLSEFPKEETKRTEEHQGETKINKLIKFFGAESNEVPILEAQLRLNDEQKKDIKKVKKITKFFGDSTIPLSSIVGKKSASTTSDSSETGIRFWEITQNEEETLPNNSNKETEEVSLFTTSEKLQIRDRAIEEFKKANPNEMEPYTTVLGIKRGRCTKEKCTCDIYLPPPNENTTNFIIHSCILCDHFPNTHKFIQTESSSQPSESSLKGEVNQQEINKKGEATEGVRKMLRNRSRSLINGRKSRESSRPKSSEFSNSAYTSLIN